MLTARVNVSAPAADAADGAPRARDAAPIVEARAVQVRYGRDRAVDGLDLTLVPGEVYALLGKNGSGKTSLVRALLGLQPLAAGTVRVLGRDPRRERAALMRAALGERAATASR